MGTNCTELGPWAGVAVVNLIEVAPPATPPIGVAVPNPLFMG